MTRRWIPPALVACAALPMALLAAGPLYDTDGWWHLRTGELILRHGSVPRVDPYSWTARGEPWQPNAWLSDVFFALLHRAGGLVALSLFKAAAVVALCVVLYAVGRRAGAPRVACAIAGVGAVAAMFLYVVERPQTISFLLFPAVLVLADAALRGSRRAAVAAAALFVVWANAHGVVVTGLAAVVALAAGHAMQTRAWRRPLLLGGVWAMATLVTPFGVETYLHAASIRSASRGIREWQHFDPFASPDRYIGWFVAAAVVALLATGRWRRPSVVLPAALLAALTVDAMRNGPLLVVVLVPEVALGIGRVRLPTLEFGRVFAALVVAVWAILTYVLVPFAVDNAGTPRTGDFSTALVAAIPPGCRLLNEYHQGGFVIWKRPDVPVSQDGRNDVYGEARLAVQDDVLHARPSPDASLRWLDAHDVRCVLSYRTTPIAGVLATNAGWRRVARAQAGVLYVRRAS